MKPISELAQERAREISEQTQREVQFYTAMWTIVRCLQSVRAGESDAFDRDLLAQWDSAHDWIISEDNQQVRGPLAAELEQFGMLRRHKRARAVNRR